MITKPGHRIFRGRTEQASALHLYEIGQPVKIRNGLGGKNLSAETFRVTGKLPVSNDLPQYRIRCDGEPYERMAAQDQLEPIGASVSDPNETLIEKTFGARG